MRLREAVWEQRVRRRKDGEELEVGVKKCINLLTSWLVLLRLKVNNSSSETTFEIQNNLPLINEKTEFTWDKTHP